MTPPRRRLAPGLGIALLAAGGTLVYSSLQRRWGYYAGPPFSPAELSRLIPACRAASTGRPPVKNGVLLAAAVATSGAAVARMRAAV